MLTDQKKQFIEEYLRLRCKNATKAAIAAGYSEKSASAQASQLLKNDEVSEYLEQRKSEIKHELQQEFIFDALEAKEVMYQILKDPLATHKDKITVARDFLDRAGFKPTDEVKVSGQLNNPFEGLSTADLKKLIDDE